MTSRYPVQVIAGVLGIPVEDYEQFQKWALASRRARRTTARACPPRRRCASTWSPSWHRGARIRATTSCRTSSPPRSTENGSPTSIVYGFLRLLLAAGAETTFRVMGSTLFALSTHPDVMARAIADDGVIDRVIEEVLRWETSVTMVNREALEAVEIAGAQVPQGGVSDLLHGIRQPRRVALRGSRAASTPTAMPSRTSRSGPVATSAWECISPGSSCASA